MNDDNLNYRFRLITFNDNVSVKNLDPEIEIPSSPEKMKPAKYSLSSAHIESDASHATAKPQPVRLSKSSTEIMAKKPYKNKVLKKPRNTICVEDFNRVITSRDNMYPDKLIDCDQDTTKNKNTKEKVINSRKKRKTQNHHKWQKDVKVIYTSETTKIPRRRRTYQPPDHFAYQAHEFHDDFDSLYKDDYYQQNIFKNNPAVYFQSSGDCRKGIFGKFKKSRDKGDENDCESCDHFPVANIGDYCEDESPSSYNCTHLPHFNVVGFPQNNKTKCQLQPQDHRRTCGQSLTTLNFNDFESDTRFMAIRSQPCPSHAYECEAGSKSNYENQSKCANKAVSEAMPKKICESDPTVKIPHSKNSSDSKATAKKKSAKLYGQSEENLKKKSVVDTKSKQTYSVTMKTRSTTPKKTPPKRSESEPLSGKTNSYLKYIFYGFAVIVFFPCVLLFSLCWLATYPLRPREAVPKLSNQSTQNNSSIRKPRERNLCHLNRAPKVLSNSIDNWSTIKHVVTCACKSALPLSQKTAPPRSCSSKPSSPLQCQKSTSSKVSCKKVSNVTFDACPLKIPPCAIQSYGQKHPDPSQQYRMFYGGALRGWLMKPLNCYGVTCKRKNRSYRNVCPTTVMPVKTAGNKTILPKQNKEKTKKVEKEKVKKEKGKTKKGKTEKDKTEKSKTEKGKTEKGKTEKKAVKFSNEIATPMPNTVQRQHPVRKGENRPCTDPRPSKKPCRVCCQPIRPDLDPSNVGLVQYGSGGDKNQQGKNPFKKTKNKVPVKKRKKSSTKKKKKPKKKKTMKSKEEKKGLVQAIRDAENEAWGDEEVKCDEIWVRTLRKKPCFWVYKRWPALYPCFLQWHSCCANCASCGIMCLSTILWCPLLICVLICYKLACKK